MTEEINTSIFPGCKTTKDVKVYLMHKTYFEVISDISKMEKDKVEYMFKMRNEYIANIRTIINSSAIIVGLIAAFGLEKLKPIIGLAFISLLITIALSVIELYSKNKNDLDAIQSELDQIIEIQTDYKNQTGELLPIVNQDESRFENWANLNLSQAEKIKNRINNQPKKYNPSGNVLSKIIYITFVFGIIIIVFSLISWSGFGTAMSNIFNVK